MTFVWTCGPSFQALIYDDLQVTRVFPEEVELDTNNNKEEAEAGGSEENSGSVPWIDDTDKESSVS